MNTDLIVATERSCKDCGTPLGPGREDRQYCDSACKTNYNNRRKKESQKLAEGKLDELSVPEYIGRIQDILLNNRRILEGICNPEKPGRLRERDLLGKGFNKKFMTSVAEPTTLGRVYVFCFEYGYYEENGWYIIVLREREVD